MTRHDKQLKKALREYLKYHFPADVLIALKDELQKAVMLDDEELVPNERVKAVFKQNAKVLNAVTELLD